MSELDPQIVGLLERMRAAGARPVGELPAADLRRNCAVAAPAAFGPGAPVASVEDRETDAGIAVRIYRPIETDDRAPMLVYFHGGGWIVGNLETHDGIVRLLARGSGRVAAAVD